MAGDLENRLKEATPEESRQLLQEFLRSFYLDKISLPSDPGLSEVTLEGHVTE